MSVMNHQLHTGRGFGHEESLLEFTNGYVEAWAGQTCDFALLEAMCLGNVVPPDHYEVHL